MFLPYVSNLRIRNEFTDLFFYVFSHYQKRGKLHRTLFLVYSEVVDDRCVCWRGLGTWRAPAICANQSNLPTHLYFRRLDKFSLLLPQWHHGF